MNKTICFTVMLCFIFACNNKATLDHEIQAEIGNLATLEEKEMYLTRIFDEDQQVRQSNSELIKLNHGKNSPEYNDYVNTQHKTDGLNLKKVSYYLAEYGHPSKFDSLNYKAMSAIWAVIQHSSVDGRERNFEYLYEAQLKGDIDISWILK